MANDVPSPLHDEDIIDENGNGQQMVKTALQLVASHEKALAIQHNKLLQGNDGELFDSSGYILPAPELCEENDNGRGCQTSRCRTIPPVFYWQPDV